MHQAVHGQPLAEIVVFRNGRQFPVEEEIHDLHEVAFVGQFFNGISTVAKDALLSVEVGDAARSSAGVLVTGVKRHHPCGTSQV